MNDHPDRRNTRTLEPSLITGPIELAKAEARIGLKQYDVGIQEAQSAIERSNSNVMWRLNWIHPFADGNGRTSRTVSYGILAIRAGNVPSGSPSIPEQIVQNRAPYFETLEAADESWKKDVLDLRACQKTNESGLGLGAVW
jgi:fido (protein-threonine AMPylation protein)